MQEQGCTTPIAPDGLRPEESGAISGMSVGAKPRQSYKRPPVNKPLGGIKCIISRNGGMMNVLKKRATIIFMLILLGGILFGCSNIKSEQSSIIDSEIEKKI